MRPQRFSGIGNQHEIQCQLSRIDGSPYVRRLEYVLVSAVRNSHRSSSQKRSQVLAPRSHEFMLTFKLALRFPLPPSNPVAAIPRGVHPRPPESEMYQTPGCSLVFTTSVRSILYYGIALSTFSPGTNTMGKRQYEGKICNW